jgi:hypothetical protein
MPPYATTHTCVCGLEAKGRPRGQGSTGWRGAAQRHVDRKIPCAGPQMSFAGAVLSLHCGQSYATRTTVQLNAHVAVLPDGRR